ncbi:MAG: glycoside hydrolase family 78 protein [Defluviitaleaceae bacterium]|nr:glycoside hydrolase family 78 protein [Defluviitaleaceae bacterium]
MNFPLNFIAATREYNDFKKYVPAPLLRKEFFIETVPAKAEVLICGLGFYELYINGKRINKLLAPYIANPDDILYYDKYDIREYLRKGENVIGIVLGNGILNAFSGKAWEFDIARFRAAPKVALKLEADDFSFESGEDFKVSSSPIFFDEYRCGEHYDARLEQPGWNLPGFDDSNWATAIPATMPYGEPKLCMADPIVITQELKPAKISKLEDGYIYDFGINMAGVCKLRINGRPGQQVNLCHGEHLVDGKLDMKSLAYFTPEGYFQKDIYICKGSGQEEYTPRFTFHGFQYVWVTGITDEQATEDLLTYLIMNSDLKERGGFACSDEVASTLQLLTRRSTLSNFYYFPMDCPHREKNGWTGDAAVSAEHILLNLNAETSFKEWLHSVRKAQNELGQLPGIVPTGGWGFTWGNGPAWDCVLVYLPYFTYVYRGDTEILAENATAIFRYVHYLSNVIQRDGGLVAVGLGDWAPPGVEFHEHKCPVNVSDSIISMDICEKAAFIFGILEMESEKAYAEAQAKILRRNIREQLIDHETMLVAGNCQTSQAMGLFYNIFEEKEKEKAFARLLKLIEAADGHMDTGILGARVIFHVLTAFGHSNLAFKMITQPTYPSYGNWVARGATTLWEHFHPEGGPVYSQNHHFFGDISAWFIKRIAGIQYNPTGKNHKEVLIKPDYIGCLDYAEAFHITPYGKIEVKWERKPEGVELYTKVPEGIMIIA